MPYYVFKIFAFHRLERVAEFAAFPAASAHAKLLRQDPAVASQCTVKVMFAESAEAAEALLTAPPRETQKYIDDD